jgi:hypothetical protein
MFEARPRARRRRCDRSGGELGGVRSRKPWRNCHPRGAGDAVCPIDTRSQLPSPRSRSGRTTSRPFASREITTDLPSKARSVAVLSTTTPKREPSETMAYEEPPGAARISTRPRRHSGIRPTKVRPKLAAICSPYRTPLDLAQSDQPVRGIGRHAEGPQRLATILHGVPQFRPEAVGRQGRRIDAVQPHRAAIANLVGERQRLLTKEQAMLRCRPVPRLPLLEEVGRQRPAAGWRRWRRPRRSSSRRRQRAARCVASTASGSFGYTPPGARATSAMCRSTGRMARSG